MTTNKTPAQLLAEYGKVSLNKAAEVAAHIGDVPSMGGVQQQMCMLMLAVGTRAAREKLKDYDFKPIVQAFFDNYYGPDKGVGRTAKPTAIDNYVSSYSRWGKAGMHAAWDAKPLALAATEATAITSLSGRAALIASFMNDKDRKAAPSKAEIDKAIAAKAKGNGERPTPLKSHATAIDALAKGMADDKALQRFVKGNDLEARYEKMTDALAIFSKALTAALGSDAGKASEEKIRKALIAKLSKDKAPPAKGAALN